MAGQRPGGFPLLVSGDWGSAEPPPALKKKLLCYFQSQKRSGGGECELRPGTATGQFLVCFIHPEVRKRVLERQVHVLDWGPRGRLWLQVAELPEDGDAVQDVGRAGGAEVPVNEPQVSLPTCQNKEMAVCAQQEKPESCEKLEVASRRSVVVTTVSGEEIEDEIVEMYFENKKKSGGGIIEAYIKKDQQMLITFQNEEDAQEVLQRKHHSVKKIDLFVKPCQVETLRELCQVEDPQGSLLSNTVLLENVPQTTQDYVLIMLVENISGLSEVDGDFSVEMIPEMRAAVVTLTGNVAAGEFAKMFNQHRRAKQQSITARCLQLTKSVRAENIPPNMTSDYITIYFENKKNGGGQVVDVQLLPDEDAAIVTFNDHEDVTNILAKKHSLNKTPIYVYPYCISLGTALYGKEGPQVKKPDPITVSLDPYIWHYLQQNNRLIEAISCEMSECNCEVTWPEPSCANPEVILHPSAVLSQQKRLLARLIKTWNGKVSSAFSHSISKYKAIKCQVNAEVWEAIRNSFTHDDEVLIISSVSKDLLVLVGEKEVATKVVQELKSLLEKAAREIEREKQKTEEIVFIGPGDYEILQSIGLEEKIRMEFPALQITYDYLQKIINLCGMPEEVYKVKGDILGYISKMPKKTLNIHPYIFQFLEHIDNGTLSQSLFMSKQINAFYELGTGVITLKARTLEDLLKAEEEIKKELDYKGITLEDESVIQKKEWSMLTKQNCCTEDVTIMKIENQIIIAGCSQAVAKAFEELFNFIDENTTEEKVIRGKPKAVIMFFEEEKTNVWGDLQNKGVKVDFGTQKKGRVISLSGPRREVLKGVNLVEETLSGLYYKRVIMTEPGARSYFKEREQYFAVTMRKEFKCLVRLEEQSEEQLEEQQEHSNIGKPCREVTIGGVVVLVYKGDLCTHAVDVVVNASNEDLKHIGGLAKALLKAAGPELQQECDELVKNRRFQPGCAVITGAGKLPCKNVIHAVGPRWNKDDAEKCVYLLRKTVKKTLQLAETYNHSSIALPAISGGIFGFPMKLCTYSIVSSIKETLEESMGDSSLKEVHLVDIAESNIQAFSQALTEVFSDDSPSFRSQQPSSTAHYPRKSKITQNSQNFPSVTTEEGIDIMVKKGSIEDATTDVVVVSVAKDLQLDKGLVSRALLSKAGQMLQMGLIEESQRRRPEEGSVLKTEGYNLGCSVVFHAIVAAWSQRHRSSKALGDIITTCLEMAEELSFKSITFPAIGTGNLGFPKSLVATLLFDKVFEFSSKNRVNSLKEVHFLLHPKDTENIQEFSDELENRCRSKVDVKVQKTSPNKASQGTASPSTSASPAQDVHEIRIGSVVFRVEEGDITKEVGDVIVNITNQTFNLKTGVSKAILSSAGQAVEDECAQLASQAQKSCITTQAGNLQCKKIIHVVAQDDIKMLVSKVLQECELQQYSSVTFPAIGTGEAGRDPAVVANNMLDAVTDFARNNSAPSVKTIKVVIFQPHLLPVFSESMKKRESPAGKSFFSMERPKQVVNYIQSKIASLRSPEKHSPKEKTQNVLEKKIEVAAVQICGESKKKVEEAESWLKSAILKDQFKTDIKDDSILHFGEAESKELQGLQKELRIALHLDSNSIQISGVEKDVWIAYSSIQKMIHRVKAAKQEEINAGLLQNVIEWKYFEKDSYVPFNSLINMHLEEAFKRKQQVTSAIINAKKHTVDLEARFATDDQGKRTHVIRVDKSEDQESTVLPATWDDMKNQRLKIVELKPETREYREVQERFLKTCQSFKIEKIERVQNPFFWKTYQIKKREIDKKNGNRNNERLLFHGTSKESLPLINNSGFNRSYAGMHAAQFGNGTYFAVNASYSASDTYSRPDAHGKKYMYLARVLVGEYSLGTKGSITPAAKDVSNSIDLFDSSTDNLKQPNMFIIFNDIQAYPEYLITFTR